MWSKDVLYFYLYSSFCISIVKYTFYLSSAGIIMIAYFLTKHPEETLRDRLHSQEQHWGVLMYPVLLAQNLDTINASVKLLKLVWGFLSYCSFSAGDLNAQYLQKMCSGFHYLPAPPSLFSRGKEEELLFEFCKKAWCAAVLTDQLKPRIPHILNCYL